MADPKKSSKAEPTYKNPKPAEDADPTTLATWALKEMPDAKTAKTKEVEAFLKTAFNGKEFKIGGRALGNAREAAGIEVAKKTPTPKKDNGKDDDDTPTLTDVDDAEKLLRELNMKPGELLKLVDRLNELGSTAKLKACLEWLDKR